LVEARRVIARAVTVVVGFPAGSGVGGSSVVFVGVGAPSGWKAAGAGPLSPTTVSGARVAPARDARWMVAGASAVTGVWSVRAAAERVGRTVGGVAARAAVRCAARAVDAAGVLAAVGVAAAPAVDARGVVAGSSAGAVGLPVWAAVGGDFGAGSVLVVGAGALVWCGSAAAASAWRATPPGTRAVLAVRAGWLVAGAWAVAEAWFV
jgi:hypothetical protein